MSDDLVKRLRKADEYEPLGHDGWEAADRIEELEAKLAKAEAAIHRITPYLSASLSDLDCGPDYIDACNQVFEADSTTLAELTGGKGEPSI